MNNWVLVSTCPKSSNHKNHNQRTQAKLFRNLTGLLYPAKEDKDEADEAREKEGLSNVCQTQPKLYVFVFVFVFVKLNKKLLQILRRFKCCQTEGLE